MRRVLAAVMAFVFLAMSGPAPAFAQVMRIKTRGSGTRTEFAEQGQINRKGGHINHLGSASEFTREFTDNLTSIAQDLGVTLLRASFRWNNVEATEGVFDWDGNDDHWVDYKYFFEKCHEKGIYVTLHLQTVPAWASDAHNGTGKSAQPPEDFQKAYNMMTALMNFTKPGGTLATMNGWNPADRVVYAIEGPNETNINDGENNQWSKWDGDSYEYDRDPAEVAQYTNGIFAAAKAADPGIKTVVGAICLLCPGSGFSTFVGNMVAAGLDGTNIDAFGFNGHYSKDSVETELNASLRTLRTVVNTIPNHTGQIPFWCLECGAGGTGCGVGAPGQSDEVTDMYGVDGALDTWRLDPTIYVDRIIWELMVDFSDFDDCDFSGFGHGGLTWYPLVAGIPPPASTCAPGSPVGCGGSTAGSRKPAYDVMKAIPNTQ